MKKVLAILLSGLLCLSFVGCGKTDNKKQNDQVKETLLNVLKNEQTFIAKTNIVSDKSTEQILEQYHFQTSADTYYSFLPKCYAFVDMDNDDIDELIIMDVKLTYYLVLHYDNKTVYGYNIGIRNLTDLKTDGSFMSSSAAGINSIGNICFDGVEYEIINKALSNENEQEYFIDGEKTDKQTLQKYFDDWNKSTTAVDWIQIEK